MVGLGYLPGGNESAALGVSGDGSVVVGFSKSSSPFDQPVRWVLDSSAEQLFSLPGSTEGQAYDASFAGDIIVGHERHPFDEPVRWTTSSVEGLGTFPGGIVNNVATAVSNDGSVVVGYGDSDTTFRQAFRWTTASGLVGLGYLPGGNYSSAAGVSANGKVIVGYSDAAPATGMESIRGLLITRGVSGLENWRLDEATDVSGDGRTIVGWGTNPEGNTEAWIATLPIPEPSISAIWSTAVVVLSLCRLPRLEG